MRQSAERRNSEALAGFHVGRAGAAADVRSSGGEHTGFGPVGTTAAELHHRSALRGRDYARGFGSNHRLESQRGEEKRFDDLCFDNGRGHSQQWLLFESQRAFRHGPNFAGEMKVFQVVEKSRADAGEGWVSAENYNILRREPDIFEEIECLVESGGQQKAALRGQRADKELKASSGMKIVFEVCRRHGELV